MSGLGVGRREEGSRAFALFQAARQAWHLGPRLTRVRVLRSNLAADRPKQQHHVRLHTMANAFSRSPWIHTFGCTTVELDTYLFMRLDTHTLGVIVAIVLIRLAPSSVSQAGQRRRGLVLSMSVINNGPAMKSLILLMFC